MHEQLTPEARAVHEALVKMLPPAKPCGICNGRDFNGGPQHLVPPALGKIEVRFGIEVDAAVFLCPLCGAVEAVRL